MPKHTARARSGSDRTSLYDDITTKIITELEAGRVPWVQPWGTAAARRRWRSARRVSGSVQQRVGPGSSAEAAPTNQCPRRRPQ